MEELRTTFIKFLILLLFPIKKNELAISWLHNFSASIQAFSFYMGMKRQGIDDALIQPYSGHESRLSLEVYSKLAINDAQEQYENVISKFPV